MKNHVLANMQNSTKPPRHMYVNGDGKSGQTFSPERLEKLCEERGIDPGDAWALGLARWAKRFERWDFEELTDKQWKEYEEYLDAVQKMMDYTYGKRRAVEMTGDIDHNHYTVSEEPMTDDDWANNYGMGAATGATESAH